MLFKLTMYDVPDFNNLIEIWEFLKKGLDGSSVGFDPTLRLSRINALIPKSTGW